ncbi:amidohydrolase [Bacillus sp. JJ1764]|uniref:amidohydrolase n=1 Tax=Bacillus sp. JJ1764 TaxID=3122964 RepID=UPI0030000C9F
MNEVTTFLNGKIFTANPKQPYASAMVVQGGKIKWIGESNELEKMEGNLVDLQGQRVLPGLIDAHMHPLFLAGAANQIACTPPLVYSIADLQGQIRLVRESHTRDNWIEGWGYDEGKLLEGRAPNRWDLDQVAPDVPVVITRTCTHIISVNSKALELAGITKDTPDPQGGKIDRDLNGEPTGVLLENAKDLILKKMPKKTIEENAAMLAELSPVLLSHGITGITELMGLREPIDYFDMYHLASERGLKQRSVLYYIWDELKNNPIMNKEKLIRENQIHIGGVKLFSDGSVSGQTAWVNPPFLGDGENYGIQTTTSEELLAAAKAAKQNDIQLVVHAMGEQAIDLIVDTFYETEGWISDGPSIRIEHAAMPTAKSIKRASEKGIAFVSQPIFIFAEIESYLKNLGHERTKQTYPFKSMLQEGIKLAFSSDAPATAWADPVNPFVGMKSAVTRHAYDGTDTGQDQKLDIETVITLYTREAQEITRIPSVGQLAEGYYADFIILNQDIFNMPSERIDQIKVLHTYIGGNLVYSLDEYLAAKG